MPRPPPPPLAERRVRPRNGLKERPGRHRVESHQLDRSHCVCTAFARPSTLKRWKPSGDTVP
eukprot:2163409-Prymnesium_polylepis.1